MRLNYLLPLAILLITACYKAPIKPEEPPKALEFEGITMKPPYTRPFGEPCTRCKNQNYKHQREVDITWVLKMRQTNLISASVTVCTNCWSATSLFRHFD